MEDKELKNSIDRLEYAIRRSNNLGWTVLRGIFYSVGWIIGLGLIATIVFYILPKTGDGNIIGRFIHSMADAVKQK